ncbi:MAG: RIP metalloprotease RseP [Desulfobacteraceae bacterium]|nr:MAG: RIP metalloprotease RseP [Desulfobacteraceae bacterium]
MSHPVIALLVVLGIVVFIHELGHFLVARWCNVGIQVFSLGFGPKVFKRKKGITEYCISAIPLGGYVKMVGDEPGARLSEEDRSISFTHKTLLQKSLIVAAGPVFNFLLGILIFYLFYQFSGIYLSTPEIGKVFDESPAFEAGIQPGDIILEIDGKPIDSFDQVSSIIRQGNGAPMNILLERGDSRVPVTVMPRIGPGKDELGQDTQRYLIGISTSGEFFHKRLNPFQAMGHSLSNNYMIIRLTIISVGRMITGNLSLDNLSGPIMIAKEAGKQAKAGMVDFVSFIAIISISIGLINLFPIPVLDGGHLMFFAIEAITRRPVNERVRGILTQMGMAMLLILMVFVFYNDISRLINGG